MTGENSDIIVEGWSPRYAAAVADVLGIEGGFVDDPVDRGGTTKYGISLRFLVAEGKIDLDGDGIADFDLDMDGEIDGQDIRRLTRGDAKYLYHRCFWLKLNADAFTAPVGEMLFDQAVNGGLKAAKKLLQKAINICLDVARSKLPPILVDGVIGPVTFAALDAVLAGLNTAIHALRAAFINVTKARYRAIVAADPKQKRFLKGWLARADRLGSA